MTTFYLVRHGQVDRTVDPTDPPLSPQGWAEASQVALYLQSRTIARMYTSPLRRARETADLIASALRLPATVEPRLRERMNYGDNPGQGFEQFVALWDACSRQRDFMPPVGDSSRGAGKRVEAFMAGVHAALPVGEVAAVAHGGLIADFLLNVCSPTQLADISPAFAAQPYSADVMRNGAITVVEYTGEDGYAVRAIALTEHIA